MDSRNYYIFVLGCDLLNDKIKKADLACDEAYELCEKVYEEFLKSEVSNDMGASTYENLRNYVQGL